MADDDDAEPKHTLKGLSARERQVLKERFGIDASKDLSLEEVERQFKITRERIRAIEERAKKRLRSTDSDPKGAAAVTLGVLGVYAPDPADPSDESYGLYLFIAGQAVFVDIREDKYLEQRKLKALDLFAHSKELEASLEQFVRSNPMFASRSVGYIGLHSNNLEQGEVFWDPTGYTVLRGLTFALE